MRRKVPGGSRNKHYRSTYRNVSLGEPIIRKATEEEKILYEKILNNTYRPEGIKAFVKVSL